jgi:hypothetical protein
MKLWQRLWLLFTVIWVVVAALNVFTILAFAEGAEREKAIYPVVFGLIVPAALYALLWGWQRLKKLLNSGSEPE